MSSFKRNFITICFFISLFTIPFFYINSHAESFSKQDSMTLSLGETRNLFFLHGDTLSSYFSSNPSIVSVSAKGTLTATAPGHANIISTVHGRIYVYSVYVSDIYNPSLENKTAANTTELTLPSNALSTNEPMLFIERNDSCTIQLSDYSQSIISRFGKPSWTSDKPKIAHVDSNGKVTALKRGSATITCKLGNVSCNTYINVITDSYDGKSSTFSILTSTGRQRTYRLFKQNAHNYPDYNRYLAWHGCATCSLATVLGAYNSNYSGILPSTLINGPEKELTTDKDWKREHVNRSLKQQMPLSLYGISSILKSSGVNNDYVRTYTEAEARTDILTHLKTGNPIIFEVRQKNKQTGKSNKRWTNSYHTMIFLGVLTNGKVIISDSVDRSWYNGGQRLKIVELSDLMRYMFPCTAFSESMYYDGARSDGGYIKIFDDNR